MAKRNPVTVSGNSGLLRTCTHAGGQMRSGPAGKGRSSFLKKRSKKLFDGCRGPVRQRKPDGKSFLVLFFKKEHLHVP
jgi:hypothetical protein